MVTQTYKWALIQQEDAAGLDKTQSLWREIVSVASKRALSERDICTQFIAFTARIPQPGRFPRPLAGSR
jgi:hypothetical protein